MDDEQHALELAYFRRLRAREATGHRDTYWLDQRIAQLELPQGGTWEATGDPEDFSDNFATQPSQPRTELDKKRERRAWAGPHRSE